ncbi:MAG: DUF6088 family protein [Coriobacteriia bacterium]|nr:DUF6088 family protein [Coriobacteriia bacterium]
MKTEAYIDYVTAAVGNTPYGVPIRTVMLADNFAEAFKMDANKARRIINVYLKRLADRGVIARIAHGIYAQMKTTVFGALVPGAEKIIADTFLNNGDEVIGYETGPALINRLGLSTLVPRERQIATNRYRAVVPAGTGITLKRPLAPVTTDNAPYLQMVEALKNMQNYPIDAENADELVRAAIKKQGLDRIQLVRYANAYLKPDELQEAVGVIFERLDEREAA